MSKMKHIAIGFNDLGGGHSQDAFGVGEYDLGTYPTYEEACDAITKFIGDYGSTRTGFITSL